MPTDFHSRETKILEEAGLAVLNDLGIKAKINNIKNISDPDYILDSGRFIDFQFSNNLNIYGDMRIDTISAYEHNGRKRVQRQIGIRQAAQNRPGVSMFPFLEQFLNIKKRGKYFENKDILAVLYFFYETNFTIGRLLQKPDKIVLIAALSIKRYIKHNWRDLIKGGALKLNDKSKLGDNFGSAFICLPLETIIDRFCSLTIRPFTPFSAPIPFYLDKKLNRLIISG